MNNKRKTISIVWVVTGLILIGLAFAGKVDEFWNGTGFALAAVGLLQLLRQHRFDRNEAYRERFETEVKDERNHFIRNKAWAWAGYIFILTMGASVIVLRIVGWDMLSTVASFIVCFMLILYWGAYMVLKRKY